MIDNTSTAPVNVTCPSCKAKVSWTERSAFRPFCSESCKNKDFMAWANEEKRIPGSPNYDELFSEDF